MVDSFGREINYMRISITDRCNLRCRYCMPDGTLMTQMSELLTYEEIVTICQIAVSLGITRFKITGGEPLVRKDCDKLIAMIKNISGVEQVTLTTNGILLEQYALKLKESGLRDVNVSLDTLDRERFAKITGFDALEQVLEGISSAIQAGLHVKLNTVLTEENSNYEDLVRYAEEKGIMVRFIELMPIGYGKKQYGLSNRQIIASMEQKYGGLEYIEEKLGNGPSIYYRIPGHTSAVGFISAIHGKFCHTCNRIRMTALGEIKACLCYDTSVSIKEPLRAGNLELVKDRLLEAIHEKPMEHCFEEIDKITEGKKMIQIGG